MNDKLYIIIRWTTTIRNNLDKLSQKLIALMIINTNTTFNTTRYWDRRCYWSDTLSYKLRLFHQHSTKIILLYPWAWATYIHINFIISITLSYSCSLGELIWFRTSNLKNNWVLIALKRKNFRMIMDYCFSWFHFCIKDGFFR